MSAASVFFALLWPTNQAAMTERKGVHIIGNVFSCFPEKTNWGQGGLSLFFLLIGTVMEVTSPCSHEPPGAQATLHVPGSSMGLEASLVLPLEGGAPKTGGTLLLSVAELQAATDTLLSYFQSTNGSQAQYITQTENVTIFSLLSTPKLQKRLTA